MRLLPMNAQPCARAALCGVAWLSAALSTPAARAQDAGLGFTLTPTFSATETVTSNRDLATTDPQADAITQLSPGIRVSSRAGRVQGSLSYALNALYYARDAQSRLQNALDATVAAELVEQHAFVDATANISQQSISAFGTQSSDNSLVNSNRTEVYSVSVAPRVRGNIAGLAEFNASLNWATSASDSTSLGDNSNYGGQMSLGGSSGKLGWGLNASRQASAFSRGRTSTSDQYGGSLSYAVQYDLSASLRLGRASSNALADERVSTQTVGGGLSWQPTERTNIDLQGDRTYYGHSHTVSLRHRMARSVWSFSDSTGISGLPNSQGVVQQPLSLYDLIYNICLSSGVSAVSCDQSVRAELLRQGLNPSAVLVRGVFRSTLTEQRTQVIAVSISGLRSTITLSAVRTSSRALGQVAPADTDLLQDAPVRQEGVTLGASHQLTESASLTFSASQQRTLDSGALPGNRQRTFLLGWSLSPGPRSSLSLNARHSQFVSVANPYSESALIASLGLRF